MPQKSVRVREEVKRFAEDMERRLRGRDKEILAGTLPHWRQMNVQGLLDKAVHNIEQIQPGASREQVMQAAADAANYIHFAAMMCAEATQE